MKWSSTGDRVASVYGALFFALGIYMPFYPLLLADRGMDVTQIGLLIGVPMALRAVVASPLGILADFVGDRRRVLMLYSTVAAITFSAFAIADGFWPLMAISIVVSLFSNASNPIVDALATSIVRQGKADYGRMRMWGSVSFVAANVIGGAVISQFSAHSLFRLLLMALWGAALVLAIAPPEEAGRHSASDERHSSEPHLGLFKHLLRDPALVGGMVAAALIQASHAMIYGFSSLYWGQTGYSGTEVGVFWAAGVVAEILMFFVSGRLFNRWRPGQMLVLSGSAAIIRWLLFPLVTTASGYLLLQSMHALTFACCHLAMMRLVVERVENRFAVTVQGFYTTVGALAMSAATLASGPLFRNFGGTGFQLMAGVDVIAIVIAFVWVGVDRKSGPDEIARA